MARPRPRFRTTATRGTAAAALACALLAAGAQPAAADHEDGHGGAGGQGEGKGHGAQEVTGPAMKITIDNARKASGRGQEATYTIRVSSLQTEPIRGLEVRQTLPRHLELVEPGDGGRVKGGEVVWDADLKGRAYAEFTARTRVGSPPARMKSLVAQACAYEKDGRTPVVCAPDIDRVAAVPAGAAAGNLADAPGGAALYGVGAGAMLLAGTTVAFVLRRRAIQRRGNGTGTSLGG